MRLLPYRLGLATGLGAMSWHPVSRADDYDRLVRLEWEPIAGAVSYEIEWVKGEDCGVSLGIEKVSQAAWKKELPAGNYCTRVRGISAGERPGFWTEFQKLTVKPKPPRFIKSTDEGKFEWDTVPYAKSYLVEVVDPAGKSVLQKEVTDTSFELPNEILKDQRYVTREKFKISVRTLTEKVPRSALREVTFQTTLPPPTPVPTPASVAKAKPAGAAQSASAPEPVPPRSLPPQPAPERAVVEALEDWRYARGLTASGERPLAPSKEEWAAAKTPEQKEVLRRRTIASARVDLEEELLQRRSTETRFLAGVGYASGFFRSSTDKDRPSTDHRGGGIHQQLEIQHNRGGAWGLFADFAERSVSGEGVKHVFYSASAGVERNFGLDSLWHSRVSLRFGLQYSSHPVEGSGNNSSDSGTFSYPMSTLGVVFGAEHQYAINHRWSWLTSVNARLAPPQTNVDGLLEKVSLLGLSVRTGAEYKFTPELGARAGFVLSGSRAEADEETGIRSQLVDLGIVLQGVYSLSPGSGRAVASESVHQSELRRLWSARAALKLGARRFTNITFSSEVPEPLSGADLRNRLGADLAL